MTSYPNREFPVNELQVGDVLQQFEGPFGTAIVEKVTAESVHLFRPYGATAGFTYGDHAPRGQTICYHGREETVFLLTDKAKFLVYRREA
jgi:hypothetical protein